MKKNVFVVCKKLLFVLVCWQVQFLSAQVGLPLRFYDAVENVTKTVDSQEALLFKDDNLLLLETKNERAYVLYDVANWQVKSEFRLKKKVGKNAKIELTYSYLEDDKLYLAFYNRKKEKVKYYLQYDLNKKRFKKIRCKSFHRGCTENQHVYYAHLSHFQLYPMGEVAVSKENNDSYTLHRAKKETKEYEKAFMGSQYEMIEFLEKHPFSFYNRSIIEKLVETVDNYQDIPKHIVESPKFSGYFDESAFQLAKKIDEASKYKEYVTVFPNGKHIVFAANKASYVTLRSDVGFPSENSLLLRYFEGDYDYIWIDFNNDGKDNDNVSWRVKRNNDWRLSINGKGQFSVYGRVKELHCNNLQLASLDVSNNVYLESLYCSGNQLTSLDVSDNVNLEELWCNNNQLTSLELGENVSLKTLSCYDNQLTSLDVSDNVNLEELWCNNNQLTSLDVSKNVNLEKLSCSNNQLTSLDVSNNVNLKTLWCSRNQLTSLDVSKNVNLEDLVCHTNSLTALDISKNVNLTGLACYNNQLTSLDVSNNVNLRYISLYDNKLDKENMTKFVNSLPSNLDNKIEEERLLRLKSYDEKAPKDTNYWDAELEGKVKAKGWRVE